MVILETLRRYRLPLFLITLGCVGYVVAIWVLL